MVRSFKNPKHHTCFKAKVRVGGGRSAGATVPSGAARLLHIPPIVSVIVSGPSLVRASASAVPSVALRASVGPRRDPTCGTGVAAGPGG